MFTRIEIKNTLKYRLVQCALAIDIANGVSDKPDGFRFPLTTNGRTRGEKAVSEWRGAMREIENTLEMMDFR